MARVAQIALLATLIAAGCGGSANENTSKANDHINGTLRSQYADGLGGLNVRQGAIYRYAGVASVRLTATAEARATATPVPERPRSDGRVDGESIPGRVLADDGMAALICSYAWDCGTALRVFGCESGLTAGAISPDGQNIGIAQINLVHGYSVQYLLDAQNNLAVAYALYSDQGWAPWACW